MSLHKVIAIDIEEDEWVLVLDNAIGVPASDTQIQQVLANNIWKKDTLGLVKLSD